MAYLKDKGITKNPDQIVSEINIIHSQYFPLHLQEATGIRQYIGNNMMSEVMDLLDGTTYRENCKNFTNKRKVVKQPANLKIFTAGMQKIQ